MKDATHSMASVEWYTPPAIVEAAREVLGGEIDLDPASCVVANSQIVHARSFYQADGPSGLDHMWEGRWFCNPPSPPREWWERAAVSWALGLGRGVFVAYSIEQLQQSQGNEWAASMMRFPICIPRSRVRYYCTASAAIFKLEKVIAKARDKRPETKAGQARLEELRAMDPNALVEGDAPTHASVIVGVGVHPGDFADVFSKIGDCL